VLVGAGLGEQLADVDRECRVCDVFAHRKMAILERCRGGV
jgi:hypothetical protein